MFKAFDYIEETENKAEISMTPLIDMIFILLIFFVVTTTFTRETGIEVNKARATTARIIQKELLLIAVDKSGGYWFDKQQLNVDHIVNAVLNEKKNNEEVTIVIIPDRDGRIEPLITLLDKLRAQNITRFSLGTQQVDNSLSERIARALVL